MLGDFSEMARDQEQKFKELATKRVNRTIKDLRLIGNLSNKNAYKYDDAQAKKIIKVLQKEVDALKAKFTGGDGDDDDYFKL